MSWVLQNEQMARRYKQRRDQPEQRPGVHRAAPGVTMGNGSQRHHLPKDLGAILMNITAYAPTSQLISVQNMSDLRMYSHLPTPTGSSLLSEGKASQRRPHSGRSWHARCSTLAGMLPLWSLGPGFLAQQGLFLSGDRTLPKACHVTS